MQRYRGAHLRNFCMDTMSQFVHENGGTKMMGHKNMKNFKLVFHLAYLADSSKLQYFNIVRAYQLTLCYIGHWRSFPYNRGIFWKLSDNLNLFPERTPKRVQIGHHPHQCSGLPLRKQRCLIFSFFGVLSGKRFKIHSFFKKFSYYREMSADDQYHIV